jgi:hypothetical protein
MAHFAKLDDDNNVIEVQVVNNEDVGDLPYPQSESVGITFLTAHSGGYTNWKQCSYNGNFRKRHAGVGYTYDSTNDVFIPPQPHASWVLDSDFDWEAPIPYPTDGEAYYWDEAAYQADTSDPKTAGWVLISDD